MRLTFEEKTPGLHCREPFTNTLIMDPTTVSLLRNAAIEALQGQQDVAAAELLSLMDLSVSPVLPAVVNTSPAQPELMTVHVEPIQFPALPLSDEGRGKAFWMQAIRDCYLPKLAQEQQTEFTTPQMFSWIDFVGFPLTNGDLQNVGSRPYWKCRAGDALDALCDMRVIHRCGFFSKTYSTVRPQQSLTPTN